MSRGAPIDGNHVLYHYLEKDLRESDIWLFQMLAARLFTALGIWFSPAAYANCPVLIPFAVRDPSCRKRKPGDVEAWGEPNEKGYFRDDNSLVKSLPRSLNIHAPGNHIYDAKKLGDGFVAAHVWRVLADEGLASRDPETNTFVPNLVWLPKQVAKLTDREGSFAQTYLQAVAVRIYRTTPVSPSLKPVVERIWEKLPMPEGIPNNGLPDVSRLAYFAEDGLFIARRKAIVASVVDALRRARGGHGPIGKIVSTRYTKGLATLGVDEIAALLAVLSEYSTALGDTG